MKKIFTLIIAILSLVACQEKLSDRIDNLDAEVTELENLCSQINQDLNATQQLVTALQEKDFITDVTPLMEKEEVIGYTIHFKKNAPITIHFGKNEEDAIIPQILPSPDQDGNYYWTLNGEWLLDGKGNKIRVNAKNGATPQFKIVHLNWYISYDNGLNWEKLGAVESTDPNFIFKKVEKTDDELILTLQDNSTFQLPFLKKVNLLLDVNNTTHLVPNKVLYIHYQLENATENTVISATSDGELVTVLEKTGEDTGVIKVLSINPDHTGHINILISDNGYTYSTVINFYNGQIVPLDSQNNYYVPNHKCIVLLPFATNMPFSVVIDKAASSWLKVLNPTKAPGDFEFAAAYIEVQANPENTIRSGRIYLVANGCSEAEYACDITQAPANASQSDDLIFKVVAQSKNGFMVSLPLSGDVDCMVNWGDGTVEHWENATKMFVEHYYENPVNEKQEYIVSVSGKVTGLYSYDLPYDSVTEVLQWGNTGLESLKYAFRGNSILTSVAKPNQNSFAQLNNVEGAFRDCFRLVQIPSAFFANCQGIKSVDHLFRGCGNLKNLPEDIFANCTGITHARYAFAETAVKQIPANLFASCKQVIDFSHLFDNCSDLTAVPAKLFSSCKNVLSYSYAFARTALAEIPADLFKNSTKVTDLSYAFGWCSDLTSLPSSLFDHNKGVMNFTKTFYRCTGLTGESPYTEIEGKKYHLYERNLLPDNFATPKETQQCFNGGSKLSDYAAIPTNWK